MRTLILLTTTVFFLAACTSTGPRVAEVEMLKQYDAVMVEPVTVEFSPHWEPLRSNSRLPLSDAEKEKVREMVASTFDRQFRKGLEEEGVTVVDTAGGNVLRITPVLRKVSISAPNPEAAIGSILVRQVGSMVLHASFADSVSGEVIVSLEDSTRNQQAGNFRHASSPYNRQFLEQQFDIWAEIIAEDMLVRKPVAR